MEVCSSFTLLSPHAVLVLRFPIPDLRPLPDRRPPTQRAVRQETLVLELTELELQHQEAPDLQREHTNTGHLGAPCLTQLLEASFTDLHGGNVNFLQAMLGLNINVKPKQTRAKIINKIPFPTMSNVCSFICKVLDIKHKILRLSDFTVFHQVHMKGGKAALSLVSE